MYTEKNTGTNLPAQIDLEAVEGMKYSFLFVAKGGGSANKTYLYQETKALLNPATLKKFLVEKMSTLGTAACPPYHIAFVIGGTSAEKCLKTVKMASTKYYDNLPTTGTNTAAPSVTWNWKRNCMKKRANWAWAPSSAASGTLWTCALSGCPATVPPARWAWESPALRTATRKPRSRRRASLLNSWKPIPGQYIPEALRMTSSEAVSIDLNRPMKEVLKELGKYPVTTRLSLNGTIIVARDIAHAKLKERLEKGEGLPQYMKDHPVYYAGPAKTPEGYPSGSFGPTTAGRMDSYVDLFQENGGSMIMIAKGNRSQR